MDVHFCPAACLFPNRLQEGPIFKISTDSEFTLLKTQHLISHTLVMIKIEKLILGLPHLFAPPLAAPGGGGRGGTIYNIRLDSESSLLKTLQLIPHTLV